MRAGLRTKSSHVALLGRSISPGISIGKALIFRHIEMEAVERNKFPVEDVASEKQRLHNAIEKSKTQLHQIKSHTAENVNEEIGAVFEVHLRLLEDKGFLQGLMDLVNEELVNIEFILAQQIRKIEKQFGSIQDENMKKRFADIQDVYHRLLRNLLEIEHVRVNPMRRVDWPVILVAERLIPSDIPLLDLKHLIGIVMEHGDNTSHVAIIAKSLQVPVVVQVPGVNSFIKNDDELIIDGYESKVIVSPGEEEIERYRELERRYAETVEYPIEEGNRCCYTNDGAKIRLDVNVSTVLEAEKAWSRGAESIGLLRTEFFYMSQTEIPSTKQESEFYQKLIEIFQYRPITIRLLDLGADKQLPYLPMLQEENPQLGCRGIRYLLAHQDLMEKQLAAILEASQGAEIKILLPFVSLCEDVENSLRIIENMKNRFGKDGKIKTGIMVEIPSAALGIRDMIESVDFVSIGTNDLIQYTFAAGRENADLETYKQLIHPVSLKLISDVVTAAHAVDKEVSVCGEIGSAENVCLLGGLGVDAVSVPTNLLDPVRKKIVSNSLECMLEIAKRAISCQKADQVKEVLGSVL